MKKRFTALLLSALLFLTLLPGVRASGLICFVGINDTIPISLPAEEAPYYSGGTLYIPYTAFHSNPNGVAVSNNVDQKTLVLFTRNSRLVYDLDAETVADEDNKTTKVSILYKNGVIFIPAVQAASHFGLSVTLLTSETGCPVLRFTNGQQVYSNDKFVEKAENLIHHILEHNAKQEAMEQESTESEIEEEVEEEPEDHGPATVYLTFAGDAVSEATLAYLDGLELHAGFFLTEKQFLENKDLVRAIYAAGHTIGLTVEEGETDVEAALIAANDAMDRVLFCKTAHVLLPGETQLQGTYVTRIQQIHTLQTDEDGLVHENVPIFYVCRGDVASILTLLRETNTVMPSFWKQQFFHNKKSVGCQSDDIQRSFV